MPFGDWNGDGDVSFGEGMFTGAVIGSFLDDATGGPPDDGDGNIGCGGCLNGCAFMIAGFVMFCMLLKILAAMFGG